MALTISVQRRTGNSYVSIIASEPVKPGEQIRLLATGIEQQLIHAPEFVIKTVAGTTVLNSTRGASIFGGEAVLDTVAPIAEGRYTAIVHAQSLPFLPFTSSAATEFHVSAGAAAPPKEPPRRGVAGIAEGLEDPVKLVLIAVLAIGALLVVSNVTSRRK